MRTDTGTLALRSRGVTTDFSVLLVSLSCPWNPALSFHPVELWKHRSRDRVPEAPGVVSKGRCKPSRCGVCVSTRRPVPLMPRAWGCR